MFVLTHLSARPSTYASSRELSRSKQSNKLDALKLVGTKRETALAVLPGTAQKENRFADIPALIEPLCLTELFHLVCLFRQVSRLHIGLDPTGAKNTYQSRNQ